MVFTQQGGEMDYEARRKQILKQMARINRMEKGRLNEEYRERTRDGETVRLGPYYKYQRWEAGRNVSRRVPATEVEQLRKAVEGYHEYDELAKEYAELTIAMTRQSAPDASKKKPR
jgi:hypothetical protein